MKRIVVLHRGWVAVGDWTEEGDVVVLRDAKIIRRWGTTSGLGQLAAEGPRRATMLDPAGVLRVHRLAVVFSLDCEAGKW